MQTPFQRAHEQMRQMQERARKNQGQMAQQGVDDRRRRRLEDWRKRIDDTRKQQEDWRRRLAHQDAARQDAARQDAARRRWNTKRAMPVLQNVEHGVVVKLEYTLQIEEELVESTEDEGPIEFLQGYGEIIPGLEAALHGMRVGQEKDVTVDPEDGYGQYDRDAFEEVPLDIFPEDMDLSLGMPVELYDEDADETVEGFIAEIGSDTVVVDLNHPLAGEVLSFHVKVVGIRAYTGRT